MTGRPGGVSQRNGLPIFGTFLSQGPQPFPQNRRFRHQFVNGLVDGVSYLRRIGGHHILVECKNVMGMFLLVFFPCRSVSSSTIGLAMPTQRCSFLFHPPGLLP